MPETAKRIAAIDVGTNSVHMIVAETNGHGYKVIDREKEMVQLGLSSLDGQPLTDQAMERGVATLKRMADLAKRWKADDIVAVATSAVREAPNRRDFLKRVRDASGIEIKVISGEEEADYIFRAVRSSVDLDGTTAFCIDIGGGSVEIIVGTAEETYFTHSVPIGALRMAQRFDLLERPSGDSIDQCREYVKERLARLSKKVRRLGTDLCIGTSGTIQTLAAITTTSGSDAPTSGLRRVMRDAIAELIPKLASLSAKQRSERFGIDEKRAVSILAGAVVLETAMQIFEIETLLACPAAMREGLLETRIARLIKPGRSGGSLRRRSVISLARRTDCDLKHAEHVARLAGRIFDQTAALHELPSDSRELLEYAAVLHEAGRHISDRGHHKHSYYLIRHGDLRGFTEDQLLITANVARYYRKAEPDAIDQNFAELTPEQRTEVERLASILRIAEAFDRGHRQRVRDVAVRINDHQARFIARTRSNASLELASAAKRAKYFASLFGVRVRIDAV